MESLTREWIDKAEEDWRVACWLLEAPIGSYSAICFHAQQAAEKLLKACLTNDRALVPRTHDLVQLVELIRLTRPAVASLIDDCKTLQPYAIEARYPGVTADLDDAKDALQCCGRIRRAMLSLLSPGGSDVDWE